LCPFRIRFPRWCPGASRGPHKLTPCAMGSALSWDPLSLCAAPANTSTAVSSSVRKEEDAWEVEQAMLQEALYQSMEQEHFAALDEQADAELQAALQQSLQPVARQESEDFPEERLRLLALLEMLGLRRGVFAAEFGSGSSAGEWA
ncbi:unnamed protein product, partial [Effrenium voratum]